MDQQNKLLQFIFNHPLLALFFFFQAILLILFTVTIIRTSTNNNSTGNLVTNEGVYNQDAIPQVKIPDLKTLYLPDDGITNIQRALASTMAQNNESYEKEIKNTLIREKHTKNFSYYNIKYINFILDLPDYKQSYQIRFEWSDDENNSNLTPNDSIIIACIRDKEKIKYKDFNCKDNLSYDPKYSDIGHYIGFTNFYDEITAYGSNEDIKKIDVNMTATDKTDEQAKKKIDSWIKSMGYTPDGFVYEYYYGDTQGAYDGI